MAVTYDGYLDGIEREDGKVYGFMATAISGITASSVSSYANTVPYEYTALNPDGSIDKIHKGLKFSNNGTEGLLELGSTGNMTIESLSKHVNIEAAQSIQVKPTDKITLDSSRRLMDGDGKNKVQVNAKFDDFGDTRYTGSAASEEWAQAYLNARSIDLCCKTHGGIAVQPAGADSSNHINKVKFEHSLKVPVEHFTTYTIAGPTTATTYSFEEQNWVCLGQILADEAVQIFGLKVLKATNACWNNGMQELINGYNGIIDENNVSWAIGYADTETATTINNGGVNNEEVEALTGKYLYIKRLNQDECENSIRETVIVSADTATTGNKTKFLIATEGITIATEQEGTEVTVTTTGSIVRTRFGNEESFAINASSAFTIDGIKYQWEGSGDTEAVYPTELSTKEFSVVDGKFTITPIYPVHFNEEGGKGIEWGTFNPLHTSLYSTTYRFKEDGEVYAVTRSGIEVDGDKSDYHTQSDDTKDILDDTKKATWAEIVKVASDYANGELNTDPSVADEHMTMDGDTLVMSLSGENNITITSGKNVKLSPAAKARICAPTLDFDYELSTNDENTTKIDGADTNLTYTFKNSISTADTAFSANSAVTVVEAFTGLVTKTSVDATISKKGKLQREFTLSVPVRDVILGVEKIKELLDKVDTLESTVADLKAKMEEYHPATE